VPKPITVQEEKKAPRAASDPKITKKTARNRPEIALRFIATGPLSEASEFNENHLPNLSIYKPPFKLCYKPSESSAISLSKLQTFKKLFPQAVINIIVDAINSYAENTREITEFPFARP
jgi:hypothetical protein